MIVMPANSTGMFFHSLGRETRKLGHLFSPGAQRGPFEWMPYALDNGAFSAWDQDANIWDESKWSEHAWKSLLVWTQTATNGKGVVQPPIWAIVPDVPGNAARTIERWPRYTDIIKEFGIPLAVAVQNAMTPEMVRRLRPEPSVICVGGTTEWKWATWRLWKDEFPRVHMLRVNSPEKLYELEHGGIESCDGTGWNRGDRTQTEGLETWARGLRNKTSMPLWPYVSRSRCKKQLTFA